MNNNKRSIYTIAITAEQARVISKACEILARLHLGQLDTIAFDVFMGMDDVDRFAKLRDGLTALQPLATGLDSPRAHHGISSPKIPDESRVAFDLHQVIRRTLAFAAHPEGGWTINFDTPMKYGAEPLAKIEQAP